MLFSYVLPDPKSYPDWEAFERDLSTARELGYDAIELQITDPAEFDAARVRHSLSSVGTTMCAFQTGATYLQRGNCLSTPDAAIRKRTLELIRSFVELAGRWKARIVFGSLQGRLSDEPDRAAAEARIRDGLAQASEWATQARVTVAFEPVQHGEIGFHNTIAAVEQVVREINLPGLRMMIDSFHMNIEERDMIAPLERIRDLLVHVHLSETNRDVLGTGHWPLAPFLAELERLNYNGFCSVGVYNTRVSRQVAMAQCMAQLCQARGRR